MKLAFAIYGRDYYAMRNYLESGIDPDEKDDLYGTPLGLAISLKDIIAVKILLHYGAHVNAPLILNEKGLIQPLHLAAGNGNLEITMLLLKRGAHIEGDTDVTPLHFAAGNGYSRVVIHLLRNGANVNARDRLGYTALHFAVQAEQTYTVDVLLHYGANANARNCRGYTALDLARFQNHYILTTILIHYMDHTKEDDTDFIALSPRNIYRDEISVIPELS